MERNGSTGDALPRKRPSGRAARTSKSLPQARGRAPALYDSLSSIDGIGPKKEALLERLGLRVLRDALELYPRSYEDRTHIVPVAGLREGERACVRAVVGTTPVLHRIRKGMELTKFTIFDETGAIGVTYFNNRYYAAQLREGEEYLFCGVVQGQGRARQLVSPAYEKKAPGEGGSIVPIYPLTAGLTQRDLMRVTDAALHAVAGEYPEFLPGYLLAEYRLPALQEALVAIHRPKTMEEVAAARRRMVFEELFLLCCGLQRMKENRRDESGLVFANTDLTAFWEALPFPPTGAQRRAIQEIAADCVGGRPMNRLVQGDVGSGKTAIAAALCVLAAQNGWQAALMAPTEILAAQHEQSLRPLFAALGFSCVLLTGSMGAAEKRSKHAAIAAGETPIVIGTHALIQKDVEFCRLGAVIADEQHRFGVGQRAMLRQKGKRPHTLVMSATPIPRTLALILYGDLDVSVLDELPPGRQPVETYAVGERMRPRIYRFIEKQLLDGGQVYVVCPLVEEGELPLKSAEQHIETLREVLPHRRIALLHGKMKQAEKDAVMSDFAAGKVDILVATTVIEVGVNVPNANLMVVEDGDRFGLSQLHQLRGRVGRGRRQSYCIFFGKDKGEKARERLKILCDTNDGFEIARADLVQRGPGDFFGQRQHGLPALHVADLTADLALMQSAREEAERLLVKQPGLESYPELRERVGRMFQSTEIFN